MIPTRFAEAAPVLHTNGWRPIPLHPTTKEPAESGWSRYNREPWSASDLGLATKSHADAACGIALPHSSLAVDLDITDPARAAEASRLAELHLGHTPLVRIGLAPKSVLLYRAQDVISSKPHPIELYCGTGQVAVFGMHAKAGRPYQWPVATPLDIAADSDELPLVTRHDIAEFLGAVKSLLEGLRNERRAIGGSGIGMDAGERLRTLQSRGVRFREAARMVLSGASDGGRHYAVRAVISAGYNSGMDEDSIARLIEQLAPPDLMQLVTEDGYLDRTLRDYRPVHTRNWRFK